MGKQKKDEEKWFSVFLSKTRIFPIEIMVVVEESQLQLSDAIHCNKTPSVDGISSEMWKRVPPPPAALGSLTCTRLYRWGPGRFLSSGSNKNDQNPFVPISCTEEGKHFTSRS